MKPTPLYRAALFTAAAAFVLIIAGGLVTSTDSGLAVPDWPLSYGSLLPPMVGGIRFEHTHRLIAGTVGLLTFALTGWLLAVERRVKVRWLGVAASGMILLQIGLGGLTVLLKLPAEISVAHACVGPAFFAILCVLALTLSPTWRHGRMTHPSQPPPVPPWMYVLTTAAIYSQLILGAILRHVGWLPHLLAAHILWAVVVFLLIMRTAGKTLKRYRGQPLLSRPAHRMIWFLLLQFVLGILTVIQGAAVATATAHVAVGALLLANSCLLTASIRLIR